MIDIVKKFLIFVFVIFLLSLSYLTFVGFETTKLNNQITNELLKLNPKLALKLNTVHFKLNPLDLSINLKTFGPKIFHNKKVVEMESIKTSILVLPLINIKISTTNLNISTKTIKLKNLVGFSRSIINTPQLYILEQLISDGYLIADINLKFDDNGNIGKNSEIKGLIREGSIDLFKKYYLNNLGLSFNIQNNKFNFEDIVFSLNKINFSSKKIALTNKNNEYLVEGNLNSENIKLNKQDLTKLLLKKNFDFNFKTLSFTSQNTFSFKTNKKIQFKDILINSDIKLGELAFKNKLFNNFFPEIKDSFNFKDHKIKINYENKNLSLKGSGKILFQKEIDTVAYSLNKKNKKYDFKTLFNFKNNRINIDLLNYNKNKNINAKLIIEGKFDKDKNLFLKNFSLKNKDDNITFYGINFNKNFKIKKIDKINLEYLDRENIKNKLLITNNNNGYLITADTFNANTLINKLLKSNNKKKLDIFSENFKVNLNMDKVHIDNKYFVQNLKGSLNISKTKIDQANITSFFNKNEKLTFTINTKNNKKITTFFSGKAEPFVAKYNFIKGFENGSLDFYSTDSGDSSYSTLKIYDFKLQELPVLTKILTLASLQGIADTLTGEGIRFEEFEMNFTTKDNLMTIDEIYAIGPAISILMDGYIDKKDLLSLKGTLVPASTINKAISNIPVLGDILVGSKIGEGVFGVSFKIKGPPKKLETTVNPIKTLTPRFITRTLEKIKKNNN